MVYVLIYILLLNNIKTNIEEKIIFLNEKTNKDTIEIITNILASQIQNKKITHYEADIIIAMSFIESSFENIIGSMGEVGMLQVLPQDAHIKELFCSLYSNCEITKNSTTFRKFLFSNPKISFELGVMEFLFWKNQYEKKLKKLYWTTFPSWVLKGIQAQDLERVKKMWIQTKLNFGDYVFVLHYNWGGRFLSSKTAWGYSTRVYQVFNKIHNYFPDELGEKNGKP